MIPATAETPKEQKARGAFYTPAAVTRFLARWAVRSREERTLEPSCGDGAFISALADRFAELGADGLSDHLYGVELEEAEARKAALLAPSAAVRVGSFFELSPDEMPGMTSVVGNPPYIRYHGWTGESRAASIRRAAQMGVELTGLASSWAAFVVWATAFLSRDDGRLALVLPAELLHADYANPVRRFLRERFSSVVIILFDRMVFDGAQVDAVLLLASNDDSAGLRVLRLPDERGLAALDLSAINEQSREPGSRWSATVDADGAALYGGLLASGKVVPLGQLASVDIGLVSGANDYFVLDPAEVKQHQLPARVLRPVVERPSDLRGLVARASELRSLFYPPEDIAPWDRHVRAYLRHGRTLGVPERYKTRTRRLWYRVPLPGQHADAFLPYMSHRTPRLVTNPDGALSTNLVHGVAFREGAPDPRIVAAAMLSAATRLSTEIEGRSYGGGVLKLETKEAERLAIPVVSEKQAASLMSLFNQLDGLLRAGESEAASASVDVVLGVAHEALSEAAESYLQRRINRKSRRPTGTTAQAGPSLGGLQA